MPQHSPFAPEVRSAAVMKIIRAALLAGALLFGVVAYNVRHAPTPESAQSIAMLRIVAYVFCLGALGAVLLVRGIRARKEPAVRSTFSTIGWAAAEACAMLGGVFMILGGEPWPYCAGILVMLFAFVQIPADPEQA